MGKGSGRRPAQIPASEVQKRWRETFGYELMHGTPNTAQRVETMRRADQVYAGRRVQMLPLQKPSR